LILYAIPTPLGGKAIDSLPHAALERVRALKDFAVETRRAPGPSSASLACRFGS
jgi:16S rRNA C1402 (ribose-2'-O) methylase RsmI